MKELDVSGVYKILCLANGKFYIGSSKDIQRRWYNHWDEKERAKTKNQMMYDDMRKYGKENFRIYVIYEGKDYKHIEKVVTYNLQPEYNIRNRTHKEPGRPRIRRWATRNEYMKYYNATHKKYFKTYYTKNAEKIKKYSRNYCKNRV
jgi:group I intron endonuclease